MAEHKGRFGVAGRALAPARFRAFRLCSRVEEVRDFLISAAKAQDLVLPIPAPTVQFAER